jgi:hypothetical protein
VQFDYLIINKNSIFDGIVYDTGILKFPTFLTSLVFKSTTMPDLNLNRIRFNEDASVMFIIFSSISSLPEELAKKYEVYKADSSLFDKLSEDYVLTLRSDTSDYEAYYTLKIKELEEDIVNISNFGGIL